LLHAFLSFYWRIFKENQTLLYIRKICDRRKLKSFREYHLVEGKNEGRKRDKNSSLRRLAFTHRNLELKDLLKFPSLAKEAKNQRPRQFFVCIKRNQWSLRDFLIVDPVDLQGSSFVLENPSTPVQGRRWAYFTKITAAM
jgi:hypothetical protein